MVMKQNKQHSLQLRVEAANQDPQCTSCNPCCLLLMDRTSEETTRISKNYCDHFGKKILYFYVIIITLGKYGKNNKNNIT